MAYHFYLDSIELPIPPSKLKLKIKNQNKSVTLINEGEVSLLKESGLTELSLTFLIPQVKYPFAVYPDGFQPAAYFLDKFEKLKTSLHPFQFIVSRMSPNGQTVLFDTNMNVSLEEYSITEDANNGSDLTIAMELKQYREYGTKKAVIKKATANQNSTQKATIYKEKQRATSKAKPKSYKVKAGDTLWKICKQQIGDGSKYSQLAKLNGIKNPNQLRVGQVIKFG